MHIKAATDCTQIEEIVDEQNEETQVPKIDDASSESGDEELASGSVESIQSRSEKKARKMLSKLGLKKIESITRVTLRRPKNVCLSWNRSFFTIQYERAWKGRVFTLLTRCQFLFVINTPEVFKSQNSDCYIVFGEAKIEDLNSQAQASAAAQMAAQAEASQSASAPESEKKQIAEEEDEGEVDETGVESKDIDLVVEQTQCSRGKAVKALKANNGDIVNA